ncbi:translation initiation factor IF-2-like isoform X1 [Camelus ferus]|uniref:Translation initiation factor IF-2-like isoform X1 n=1 Tax=Camelus ferus TaxID=419612 RepID=A0A8B8S794_CAMFR|nr:translation initiation factor IF-2-like isoform X1 [Camelus ferus]XP_032326097.1 translation initiation factor IF-2-like isoform X1 [Camelus ferus]XP_032326098.1 translation initiation factor IF-2-like isoform X1 [Camelus ferus]
MDGARPTNRVTRYSRGSAERPGEAAWTPPPRLGPRPAGHRAPAPARGRLGVRARGPRPALRPSDAHVRPPPPPRVPPGTAHLVPVRGGRSRAPEGRRAGPRPESACCPRPRREPGRRGRRAQGSRPARPRTPSGPGTPLSRRPEGAGRQAARCTSPTAPVGTGLRPRRGRPAQAGFCVVCGLSSVENFEDLQIEVKESQSGRKVSAQYRRMWSLPRAAAGRGRRREESASPGRGRAPSATAAGRESGAAAPVPPPSEHVAGRRGRGGPARGGGRVRVAGSQALPCGRPERGAPAGALRGNKGLRCRQITSHQNNRQF